MPSSKSRLNRQRRAQLKAQGMVYVRGWVTEAQAAVIQAIMDGKAASYQPEQHSVDTDTVARTMDDTLWPTRIRQDAPFEYLGEHHGKVLQLRPKSGQRRAWTVWLGNDELGTVYRHRVEEEDLSVTVWIAYRPHGQNTRHETREHAIDALLQEYRGI